MVPGFRSAIQCSVSYRQSLKKNNNAIKIAITSSKGCKVFMMYPQIIARSLRRKRSQTE